MTDFTLFDKAIKLCWVKRLCSAEHSPWKIIPLSLLSNVGGFLLFRCNYDVKLLKLRDLLPTFYKNIIAYWQELNTHVPNNKEEVLNQTIWNNRFIKINKTSVFYQNWNRNGVQNLSCLMNVSENSFLSFDSFQRKFNLKCTFLQYFGLLAAIPRRWKDLLNVQGFQETLTSQLTMDKLNCKDLYNLIINCKTLPPPTAEKRLIECGYDASKRRIIYSLPFRVTKEIKLAILPQFKYLNFIKCSFILHLRDKYELSIDQLPVGLIAQLVRTLHRYRRGHGFDSRSSLNFFTFLLFNRLG